jgi:hypothetical protein
MSLHLPPQTLSRALIFRLLGHVLVCGVLHIAYQAPDRVKGQYMVCALYKSCLVLATTSRLFTPYNVVASIPLANGSIEEPDNGRGWSTVTSQYFAITDKNTRSPMSHCPIHLEASIRAWPSLVRNNSQRMLRPRRRGVEKGATRSYRLRNA